MIQINKNELVYSLAIKMYKSKFAYINSEWEINTVVSFIERELKYNHVAHKILINSEKSCAIITDPVNTRINSNIFVCNNKWGYFDDNEFAEQLNIAKNYVIAIFDHKDTTYGHYVRRLANFKADFHKTHIHGDFTGWDITEEEFKRYHKLKILNE